MKSAYRIYDNTLQNIKDQHLFKVESEITSKQGNHLLLKDGRKLINFCANNYLGLGGSKFMINAAKQGLDQYGFGMNSVRFICGTQDIHKDLERSIAQFLHADDAILFSSCFDANTGLFEILLQKEDVIISDRLNHASIIDGIRLCKAERKVYDNANLEDLEAKLKESSHARIKMIATDGVFSMDGTLAPLKGIVELAEKYDALVMVDESHATGVIGQTGRGTLEEQEVLGKVDIITGTFGKALGGASGGFVCSSKAIVEMLRQKARPYLFSNSLSPSITYAQIQALDYLKQNHDLVETLRTNTQYLRKGLKDLGFDIPDSSHPIVPVMFYDEQKAKQASEHLFKEGIYAINFSFPVVPKGQARVRLQVNAIHTKEDLDHCLKAFQAIKATL